MECNSLIPLAQIGARVILMSLVSLGAILSIYWGWRLYKEAVQSRVSGEVQSKSITLKFVSAGPGVVLAGFGAWLLSSVATHQAFEYNMSLEGQAAAAHRMEYVMQGRLMTVAAATRATGDKSKDATQAAPAAAPVCVCRPFRLAISIKSMGGIAKVPSNQEILQGLDEALAALRATHASGSTIAPQTLKTLESLEYLKDLATGEVARDQSEAGGKL